MARITTKELDTRLAKLETLVATQQCALTAQRERIESLELELRTLQGEVASATLNESTNEPERAAWIHEQPEQGFTYKDANAQAKLLAQRGKRVKTQRIEGTDRFRIVPL